MNEEKGLQQFIKICLSATSEDQLRQLYDLFFTLEEKHDIAMRLSLIKELLKGEKTQREIAQHLGISIAKITRGSNALKITSEELKQFIVSSLSGE